MSRSGRRTLAAWGTAALLVLGGWLLWPGDPPPGDSLGARGVGAVVAWLAATAAFLIGALYLALGIVRTTWRGSGFDPNRFLSNGD